MPSTPDVPGVVELPTSVFTPAITEPADNPMAVDPRVPVIAIPSDAAVVTCDAQCVENAISLAGLTDGTVEMSIGDGSWQPMPAGSSFAAPSGASNIRIRVTPESGDPVVMSAVMTRDPINAASAASPVKTTADLEISSDTEAPSNGSGSAADGPGFPWWIIVLVLIIVVIAVAVMRRRTTTGDTSEDSTTA